jgi:hypothetical protein
MYVPRIHFDISPKCAARLTTVIYSEFVLTMTNVSPGIHMAVNIKIGFLGYGISTMKMTLLRPSETSAPI